MNTFSELIGTALLHFIWQGALVAILLALVLLFLRKAPAQVRYSLCWFALIVMIVLPVRSIWKDYQALPDAEMQVREATAAVLESHAASQLEEAPADANESEASVAEVEESTTPVLAPEDKPGVLGSIKPYLTIFWIIGVVVMTIRLFGGWMVVSRLKTRDSEPVEAALQSAFDRLIEHAGIHGHVILRQTKACTEVLLIGWIKPAILLPMSVVSEMSTSHLEAIIAHELAHIKRYDYILSGVQAVIETLLFYHPAVWWVSKQVRIEREHCCDDLAVAIIDDRARYARALYELEAKRNTFIRFALSANDGSLLSRITRLVAVPTAKSGTYMRTSLSSMLVVFVVGMSLMIGSCTDLSIDTENPVSVGVEFAIPEALETMVILDNWEGAIDYLHRVRNEEDIDEALEMTLGAYAKADESLRSKLMFVLAHIDSREADDALVEIAETDPSMNVRHSAIRSINIRIVDDPEMGSELVRGLGIPPGTEYKYPAMSLQRERALTSALQHIARDNDQGTGVRQEALKALLHRDDLGGFFDEVIAGSTDDMFTLQAINVLEKQKQYIPELMAVYQRSVDYSTRGFALMELGNAGAAEAFPLMFEALLESTQGWDDIEKSGKMPPSIQLAWNSEWAIGNLYRQISPGQQNVLVNDLISSVTDFLDRVEQEADAGFASEQVKKGRLIQSYRVHSLLKNFSRRAAPGAPELQRLIERNEAFAKRHEGDEKVKVL